LYLDFLTVKKMKILSILLQAPAGGGGNWTGIMMILMLVVIFYFFMIRPQQKKQKEVQKMRDSLKTGDRVVTSGGIYGKIKEIEDSAFLIEIADGVRVKVEKASVFATSNEISTHR
jgi:preprotein translocase subunit YajC